ncbi:hypothetical protein D6825_03275 [Candidatus Woesearchaeota archaeon]|nr:MAG: hypothetical protein D6825_03275 [Candidatus Woesearchaeota archaeon]
MARDQFDKDLEEYLHARRASKSFRNYISSIMPNKRKTEGIKKTASEALEDEQKVQKQEAKAREEHNQHSQEDKASSKKDKDALNSETKRESIFSRIFKKDESEKISELEDQKKQAVEDLKEVAKIALKAIKQLPEEDLRFFKTSPDFARLKSILEKHKLIK